MWAADVTYIPMACGFTIWWRSSTGPAGPGSGTGGNGYSAVRACRLAALEQEALL